mmetsp:Transcript_41004/g.108374  ORF Transcript_41004/g.108374 Transcript_41004/m.108374 type:complete len:281 (+) Transcript_41004:2-844(+)
MAGADALWSSPLTRALQTALVALEPLLQLPGRTLELKLNVREKKNFGGLDSIGRVCGDECYQRALAELRSMDEGEGGPTSADMGPLSSLSVDPVEVGEEWWVSDGAEDSKSLDERLNELLHQIEHAPAERIVIVGHSHYYRAFFKRFLHPAFFHRDAGLARTLQTKSVPNCCVLSCSLDFSFRPYPVMNVSEINFNPPTGAPGTKHAAKVPAPRCAAPLTAHGSGGSARSRAPIEQPTRASAQRPAGAHQAGVSSSGNNQMAAARNGMISFIKKMHTNKL